MYSAVSIMQHNHSNIWSKSSLRRYARTPKDKQINHSFGFCSTPPAFHSSSSRFGLLPQFWFWFYIFCVSALLEYNQCVLVSRKDPESRKKAVTHISERLTSNGYWPQVSCPRTENQKAAPKCLSWLKYYTGPFAASLPPLSVLNFLSLSLSSNLECQEIKR